MEKLFGMNGEKKENRTGMEVIQFEVGDRGQRGFMAFEKVIIVR